jgi:catechol 2,3-dioxygenase-like lactoylglutathione lyase family enzyme
VAAVRYLVDDLDVAVAFYVDRLGFTVQEDWGPVVIVSGSGVELWLSGPESSATREYPGGIRPSGGGWNRFVIHVDDLDRSLADLTASGVPVRDEILASPAGRWIVVEDPTGNPVELFEPR